MLFLRKNVNYRNKKGGKRVRSDNHRPAIEGYHTVFDVAKLFGVHHRSVRRWIARGWLKAYQLPNSAYMISDENLAEFKKNHWLVKVNHAVG